MDENEITLVVSSTLTQMDEIAITLVVSSTLTQMDENAITLVVVVVVLLVCLLALVDTKYIT
jgi:hypothetical protein